MIPPASYETVIDPEANRLYAIAKNDDGTKTVWLWDLSELDPVMPWANEPLGSFVMPAEPQPEGRWEVTADDPTEQHQADVLAGLINHLDKR